MRTTPSKEKSLLREELARQEAEFLRAGGQVEKVPVGISKYTPLSSQEQRELGSKHAARNSGL
jgi:hypothetical protein